MDVCIKLVKCKLSAVFHLWNSEISWQTHDWGNDSTNTSSLHHVNSLLCVINWYSVSQLQRCYYNATARIVPFGWKYDHIMSVLNEVNSSKVHEANIGPIWGRQDPGGPHVGPMNFAIWVDIAWNVWTTTVLPSPPIPWGAHCLYSLSVHICWHFQEQSEDTCL